LMTGVNRSFKSYQKTNDGIDLAGLFEKSRNFGGIL